MTPISLAEKVITLIHNNDNTLEPSCGTGVFLNLIDNAIGCELQEELIPKKLKHRVKFKNFFDLPISQKFRTIIGNPPYVNGRDINIKKTYKTILPLTANLYLHFIEKCFYHLEKEGDELIFIVPTSLFTGSYGCKLRKLMLKHGGFTDIWWNILVNWENASVETCVFRYELGANPLTTNKNGEQKYVSEHHGFMFLVDFIPKKIIGDYFEAKVGSAPRKDLLRKPEDKNAIEYYTVKNSYFYDISNLSIWPRYVQPKSGMKILFDPGPTRRKPFFKVSNVDRYVCYALIPKSKELDLNLWCSCLENYDIWEDLGFFLNGRWSAGPKAIEATPLSPNFFK